MFSYPIVRLSSKEHVESLQKGHLFLRHNTYYQRLEVHDEARSDPFDGSIPFPDDGTLSSIAKSEIKNARIMKFTSYVACFYHFHCIKGEFFYVPEDDKQSLRDFKSDTALIINTVEFERRIRTACEEKGLTSLMRDVFYISPTQEEEIAFNIHNGYVSLIIHEPQFVKSNRFFDQHEYRVSIDHTPDFLLSRINGQIISLDQGEAETLCNSTYTIELGSLEDISEMVTTDELFNSYFKANY